MVERSLGHAAHTEQLLQPHAGKPHPEHKASPRLKDALAGQFGFAGFGHGAHIEGNRPVV